jgi:hypothetical protein
MVIPLSGKVHKTGKTSENKELALWHLVNRLVLEMHKNTTKCKKHKENGV